MHYEPPDLDDFREVRRGLPVLAAVLFVVALAFPMWVIHVKAVQYPNTTLHLKLYAYPRIAGDYAEMANLNKYIGFYYPDPVYWQPNYEPHPYAIDVPEWSAGPLAFIAVSLLSVFVAIAPDTRRLKRGVTAQFAGTVLVFTVMLADIQYRLWQAGHHLDPDAPVMGVDGFTPPIWGTYEVANITSYSRFGLGAYLSMAAIGALAMAFYYRDTEVRFEDIPARFRDRLEGVRRRLPVGGSGQSETNEDADREPGDEPAPTADDGGDVRGSDDDVAAAPTDAGEDGTASPTDEEVPTAPDGVGR